MRSRPVVLLLCVCFAIPLSCGGGGGGGAVNDGVLKGLRAVDALGTTATGPTGVVPAYLSGSIPPGGTIGDAHPLTAGYWDFDYVGLNQGAFNTTVQLTDATGANVGNPAILFSAGHDYSPLQDASACMSADALQIVLEATLDGVLYDVAGATTPVGGTNVLTTWTSADPSVIEVSANGLLTAETNNACTRITWSITAQDPDALPIDPAAQTGSFAACVDSGGVDTTTRGIWLPVGDVDANLPGLPSGPPSPRVGENVSVTWIVNAGTHSVGALSVRTEYNAADITEDPAVDSQSVGGSSSALGLPFAVDPNGDGHAIWQPNATRWNDVNASGTASGIFDIGTQTFIAISAGDTWLYYINAELADGGACNIWVTNPCMPYNSFACPTPPPVGGYTTIAGSGVITVLP